MNTMNDTTTTTRDAMINNVNDRQKIDALIEQLHDASQRRDRRACKRIRASLRRLNHFGGTKQRSSRYYDVTRDAYDVHAIIDRHERLHCDDIA